MTRAMSSRERVLAIAVGAIAFLLVSFLAVDFFVKGQARARAEIASKAKQLKMMQALIAEKALWEARDAWLHSKQPKLGDVDLAGGALLDQVKEIARKHTVLLDNPAIRVPDRRPEYTSVSVEVETKSPWPALIAFLGEMQAPEQFVVFESVNLKIDATDPAQMRGRFRIARWYAPP